MHEAIAHLVSKSPYSQSRNHDTPKLPREIPKDYEERTWKERLHVGKDGLVFIPPMAFHNCLAETAKYRSEQIPGKGKATYTKHFDAGIMIPEPLALPFTPDDIDGEWLYLNSDGKRGGGSRVWKCYPVIPEWEGKLQILVFDDIITKDVLARHVEMGGQFIGVGRFRPRNRGYYGRFVCEKLEWK